MQLFWGVSGIAFILTLLSLIQNPPQIHLSPPSLNDWILTTWFDVRQNLPYLFQGVWGGYLRTVLGYMIFFLMGTFFWVSGKLLLDLMFTWKAEAPLALANLNRMEVFAYSYLLGSLFTSLLWFGLGELQWIKIETALGLILIGLSLFAVTLYEGVKKKTAGLTAPRLFWRKISGIEKILIIILAVFLGMLSAAAFDIPLLGDTVITHLGLPGYYVNHGAVVINPYNYQSFIPQNMEMLMIWPLLLNSEFAAQLIVWGACVVFVLQVWGFLLRHTNNLIALLAVFIVLSAPIFILSVTCVKNDIFGAMFLFAHFCALMEVLNEPDKTSGTLKRWALLSGLFCGGAVGHKLILMPALIWSCLALMLNDYQQMKKKANHRFLSPFWICGVFMVLAPWFLRTYLATGNPVYPFLNNLFGIHSASPRSVDTTKYFGFNTQGAAGVLTYLRDLTFPNKGIINGWGASVVLALLTPWVMVGNFPRGIRFSLGVVLLSLISLMPWMQINYHLFFWIFLVVTPFAFILNQFFSGLNRLCRHALVLGVLLCFFQMPSTVNFWNRSLEQAHRMFSGNLPGNYMIPGGFDKPPNMRWINHLINTRTSPEDTVMYAELTMPFSTNRKTISGDHHLGDPFKDLLSESRDIAGLREALSRLGVRHIVASSNVNLKFIVDSSQNQSFGIWQWAKLYYEKRELVSELFDHQMVLKFGSPNRKILWYTFDFNSTPINLNEMDGREYPLMVVEEAKVQLDMGYPQDAREILEIALRAPMSLENKLLVYKTLASIYKMSGDQKRAKELLDSAQALAPWRKFPDL